MLGLIHIGMIGMISDRSGKLTSKMSLMRRGGMVGVVMRKRSTGRNRIMSRESIMTVTMKMMMAVIGTVTRNGNIGWNWIVAVESIMVVMMRRITMTVKVSSTSTPSLSPT